MSDKVAAVPENDYAAEFAAFIRSPETNLRDMVTWLVERNLDVTFRVPEAKDPSRPGNFYVNGNLAMTFEEWAAKSAQS